MSPGDFIFVGIGVLLICAAIFDWNLLMASRKGQFISKIVTRTGARIFYALLGSWLIILVILTAMGIVGPTEQ